MLYQRSDTIQKKPPNWKGSIKEEDINDMKVKKKKENIVKKEKASNDEKSIKSEEQAEEYEWDMKSTQEAVSLSIYSLMDIDNIHRLVNMGVGSDLILSCMIKQ